MDVFDSSVWIYGVTQTCDEAVVLVDDVINGSQSVAVSAYIFNEVIEGIAQSSNDSQAVTEAQTRFGEIVHGNPWVDAPTQADVTRMDIRAIRQNNWVQLLGQTWGIQPKDVPIIELAANVTNGTTIVFTADRSLSKFVPSNHGLTDITLQYVDCSN